jgi:4a-hydroxytetrahydrobiopterin dehydratase
MTEPSTTAIAGLIKNGWVESDKKLCKEYKFATFGDAFAFMNACVPEIEKLDHHPEWLNVYDKVKVELTTHSAGRITTKDVALAAIMDKLAAGFTNKAE